MDEASDPTPRITVWRLYPESVQDFYTELGRVVVEWSQLTSLLRSSLIEQAPGGQPVIPDAITVESIRTLIAEFFAATEQRLVARGVDDPEDAIIAKKLQSWLHRLHDERNRVVHDEWLGSSASKHEHLRVDTRWLGLPDRLFDRSVAVTPQQLMELADEIRSATLVALYFQMRRQFGRPEQLVWQVEPDRVRVVFPDGRTI